MGLVFFVWYYGAKRGDLQMLGLLSYGTPLLSTLLLVVLRQAQMSLVIVAACVLIVGGALVASKDEPARLCQR